MSQTTSLLEPSFQSAQYKFSDLFQLMQITKTGKIVAAHQQRGYRGADNCGCDSQVVELFQVVIIGIHMCQGREKMSRARTRTEQDDALPSLLSKEVPCEPHRVEDQGRQKMRPHVDPLVWVT
jgi:hypothetical protein